ncbi:hypothetical protein ACFV6F_36825 [Kitasatospora phosalacinea]|uniref:hypothetical protein n=1 Tax=Kitasatospora phosalacinea TaxID=2065 RepID=UPI003653951E
MSDATSLDHADAMIEKAWNLPIAELATTAVRRPVEDPLLVAALRTRSHLTVVSNSVAVHQDRLHALSRPNRVLAHYDLAALTDTASALRTAYAESYSALASLRHLVEAREAVTADLAAERVRAATARTAPSRPLGLAADRPAPPVPAAPVPEAANRR